MKLRVNNLGPIKKGEIDLSKRFSVFVGYNNSGKTYMSQVVWSLLNFWSKKNKSEIDMLTGSVIGPRIITPNNYLILFETQQDKVTLLLELEYLKSVFNYYYEKIKDEVIDNFSTNEMISSFNNLKISFVDDVNIFKQQSINFNYAFGDNYYAIQKSKDSFELNINKYPSKSEDILFKFNFKGKDKLILNYFVYDFVTSIFEVEVKENDKFFLPADRSFYASYYKYIYASNKDDFEKFQQLLRNNKFDIQIDSSYTSSANDLIRNIYNLNLKTPKESNIYKDLLEELQKVIGGDIVTRSSNPDISSLATFKFQMENKEELDMHLSSSSVNQLTTLYLYFKYWAKEKGNTLIIDEPEENLHPRNQIALLNILMKFAKRNENRVIITTHSPLITDVVNNHLHLGYLAEKFNKNIRELISENNLEIDADAALSHSDIGIYFFDGKSIKEYEVDEYGVDFKDFRKEQEKIEDIGDTLRGLILTEKKNKLRELNQKRTEHV